MNYDLCDIDFWLEISDELVDRAGLDSYHSDDLKYSIYEIRVKGISLEFCCTVIDKAEDSDRKNLLLIARGEDDQLFPEIIKIIKLKYKEFFTIIRSEFEEEQALQVIDYEKDSSEIRNLITFLVNKIYHSDLRSHKFNDPSLSFPNYPPVRHRSERIWTSNILSKKSELKKIFKACKIYDEIERIVTEHLNIDVVVFLKNEKIISIEAMDQNGICDNNHFEKGTSYYPNMLGEKCGHAILIAAKFLKKHIKKYHKNKSLYDYSVHLVTCNYEKEVVVYNKINN